jgi:hypothetical protein
VAGLALVVAVSSGTAAVAASLITGAQIKDRSIAAIDVAKNTLTGVEVNESKLGVVPRATTADKLAGVAASGYLRSTHVESGAVDYGTFVGGQVGTIFTDSRVGLRVAYEYPAHLYLENLSATSTIHILGIGGYLTPAITDLSVVPGAHVSISYEGVGMKYGSFLVTSHRVPVSANASLQLTCGLEDSPTQTSFTCVGVG